MRTFIAIDLAKEIKQMIEAFIRTLNTGDRGIRWVRTQGMHLTLKFLGEASEGNITKVNSQLELIAKDYSPFRLTLKGTGSFPPGARTPRVIWIGIETDETLKNIQSRVENAVFRLGFPKEYRRFHPHLTLGRIKGKPNLAKVLESLEAHRETDFGGMNVEKLTLFKSTLKPSGAEYSVISEFFLE